jgi:benzoyl-CoA 2,3-dioxygenase component A
MMEQGVLDAFRDVCRQNGADWDALKSDLLAKNRLHIETY